MARPFSWRIHGAGPTALWRATATRAGGARPRTPRTPSYGSLDKRGSWHQLVEGNPMPGGHAWSANDTAWSNITLRALGGAAGVRTAAAANSASTGGGAATGRGAAAPISASTGSSAEYARTAAAAGSASTSGSADDARSAAAPAVIT
eukprot:scaffold45612_cov58-Phaeocystis_antarctica.AAC.3